MIKEPAQTLNFVGGLNTDTDPRMLPEGDHLYAKNVRNGFNEEFGGMVKVEGNRLVDAGFITAGSKVIGGTNDPQSNWYYYFVWSPDGDHKICRLDPVNEVVEIVFESDLLPFEEDWLIHKARIIDSRLLYWIDGRTVGGELQGRPPYMIDVQRAITDKQLVGHLILDEGWLTVGREYRIEATDQDGNVVIADQVLATVPGSPTESGVIASIVDNANFLGAECSTSYLTSSDWPNYIIVSHPTNGVEVNIYVSGGVQTLPVNYYFLSSMRPLEVVKPSPTEVSAEFRQDASRSSGRLSRAPMQFRCRYVFDTGEKTAWGAASYSPTNFTALSGATQAMDVENDDDYNAIRIYVDDPKMQDDDWRQRIVSVEFAVRFGEEAIWRYIGSKAREDFFADNLWYDFYGEYSLPAVPSDDVAAADQQALKNYDFCPLLANDLEVIADSQGRTLMAYLGCLERFDVPDVYGVVEEDPYTAASPSGSQRSLFKTLKSGGAYKVYIVYEDQFGRQSAAREIGDIQIGWNQSVDTLKGLSIEMLTTPPEWAVRYRFAISKNLNQSQYVQVPAWEVDHWSYDPTTNLFTSTTFGAADHTHTSFNFDLFDPDDASAGNFVFEYLEENGVFLVPQNQDRIHIVGAIGRPTFDPNDVNDYDYPVAGYAVTNPAGGSSSDERFRVFVEAGDMPSFALSGPVATQYILCEIYRQQQADVEDIAFEYSGTFDIINPGQNNRAHQSAHEIRYGDTIAINRIFKNNLSGGGPFDVKIIGHQRDTLYYGRTEKITDLGRPVAVDENEEQLYLYDRIRATDVRNPGGFNGLSSFRSTNYVEINRMYGAGTALAYSNRVLLAVCQRKSQAIYIGSDTVLDLSGSTLVGRSSDLFNIGNPYMESLGSENPESVKVANGRIYGWDRYHGVFWRHTSGGGQVSISRYKTSNLFTRLGRDSQGVRSDLDQCITAPHREFEQVYALFRNDNHNECWGFQEKSIGGQRKVEWVGEYGYQNADWIDEAGNYLVSFLGGRAHVHTSQSDLLYGGEIISEVKKAFNVSPGAVKIFDAISIVCDDKLEIPEIEVLPSGSYPAGMLSRLPESRLNLYEGQLWGSFLRDQNDPNFDVADYSSQLERDAAALLQGRLLRGEVIICIFRYTRASRINLTSIYVSV